MKRLCSTADMIEAQLIADMLKQDGIATHIFNQYARGAMGEIPFTHAYPEIWLVREQDRERAQAVVRALQDRTASEARKPCRHCGEDLPTHLLTCWHCGTHQ